MAETNSPTQKTIGCQQGGGNRIREMEKVKKERGQLDVLSEMIGWRHGFENKTLRGNWAFVKREKHKAGKNLKKRVNAGQQAVKCKQIVRGRKVRGTSRERDISKK